MGDVESFHMADHCDNDAVAIFCSRFRSRLLKFRTLCYFIIQNWNSFYTSGFWCFVHGCEKVVYKTLLWNGIFVTLVGSMQVWGWGGGWGAQSCSYRVPVIDTTPTPLDTMDRWLEWVHFITVLDDGLCMVALKGHRTSQISLQLSAMSLVSLQISLQIFAMSQIFAKIFAKIVATS